MKKKKTIKSKNESKEKKEDVLDQLGYYLYKNDYHPDRTDDILEVCGTAWVLTENKREFGLSFEVSTEPTWAASLTSDVIKFSKSVGYSVEIYNPYALVLNEDEDEIIEVLFGDEAQEYFHTGKLPDKVAKELQKSDKKKDSKESEEIDPQKKVDEILDQITKNGIQSLKDSQRKFLKKYSHQDIHKSKPNSENKEDDKDGDNLEQK